MSYIVEKNIFPFRRRQHESDFTTVTKVAPISTEFGEITHVFLIS